MTKPNRITIAAAVSALAWIFATGPAPAATAAQEKQQEKMKTCNADAAAQKLTGDARKKFMSDCLSSK